MPRWPRLSSFWRNLFHKDRVESELDAEVSAFVEQLTDEKINAGMSPEEARRAALIELGGVEQVKEQVRDVRIGALLETLLQDVRYGLRMLAKNPGFTAIAVLTLALGIGVNTAMFSIVNLLLLRPLPIDAPDQITFLTSRQKSGATSSHFSYLDLQDIRQQASSAFSNVAGVQPFAMEGLSFSGKSEPMWTSYVSGNFFEMMGVQPALGRLILPAEGKVAGADPVLVLGYAYWKRRFGGDPGIVGKTVEVNGHQVTVVGVAPEGFRGISEILDTQAYLPVGMQVLDDRTQGDFLSRREAKDLFLIARLRAGVGIESGQSTLRVVGQRLAQEYPKDDRWTTLQASHLGPLGPFTDTTDPMPMVAAIFLTLAALVLLLAGVNVANTLLVRATARQREMAIRAALGAARARLVRQLLTETLVLGLLGCGGGIFLGFGTIQALSSIPVQTAIPIVFDFRVDWRVFAYAFAAGLLVALLVGTFPALTASRGRLSGILHEGGRSVTGGGQRLRKSLVVVQVAGSLVLLIIAGLFARSLRKVQNSDLGFDPSHVFNLSLDAHEAGYNEPRARAFQQELLEHVRALPGVQSACLAATVPMGYYSEGSSLQIEGYELRPGHEDLHAGYNVVSPEYFATMRIPLMQGRDIRKTDGPDTPRVAVINQVMAERFWPQQNPLGRHFTMTVDPEHPVEVIGVVKNSRTASLYGPYGRFFYLAFSQKYMLPVTLQVRIAGSPEAIAPQVLSIIRTLEPAMPVFDVMTMTKALDTLNGLMQFRLASGLAACFGVLGLILALVGVYGVVSYSAVQRTHEFGIRMALGAERQDVLRLVIGQGFRLTFLGVAIGVGSALALTQLLASLLYEVKPTDPATFFTVPLFLAAVALIASYIPARRATKVDPMVALRYE